jgi:nifR3 family TIM-barrel protein
VKIAEISVEPNVVLAPMAGITSAPFRLLARRYGAGMSWSELISSTALVRGGEKSQEKSHQLAYFHEEERPVAVQIFGADVDMMREAAAIIAATKPDAVDINMGCSVPKIAKCGGGCLMMKTPEASQKVFAATVEGAARFGVPVTLKMRAGWDEMHINAPEMAQRAQDVGIVAVSVHPRTAKQAFTGKSDWSVIRKVKETVQIPVIGCGDVESGEDAKRMLDETGCDGVMIGRAAQGNPWLFARVAQYLKDGTEPPDIAPEEKIDTAMWHARALIELKGERTAMNEMRRHAAWYTKGFPESARLRDRLCRVESIGELEDIFAECLAAYVRHGLEREEYLKSRVLTA